MGELNTYRELVVRVLCDASRPLAFSELAEEVASRLGRQPNLFLLRRAVAGLVREGVIDRLPDHGRRVMVFAVPPSRCRQGVA